MLESPPGLFLDKSALSKSHLQDCNRLVRNKTPMDCVTVRMLHFSIPRRTPTEPVKGTTTGTGRPANPPRRPDLHRLASELAAEWCGRHEEHASEAFEVTL